MICSSLRPRRSRGVVLPGAQSLLSAAGKMQAVQALRVFKQNYPRLLSFFPRGVLFSHTSFAKEKTHTNRASFFFWKTGVDILSRARVRVIHRALLRLRRKNVRRVARPSRDVFLLRRENLSAPVLRVLIKTIRTVADFPSTDLLLGCPRKIISVVYKTKTPN